MDVILRHMVDAQALIAPALMLFRFYREGTIYMRLFEADNRTWTSPHIYVMAVLIVAIKTVYGLDGLPRTQPEGLPAAPQWSQWADSALYQLQGPMSPSPNAQASQNLFPNSGSLVVDCMQVSMKASAFAVKKVIPGRLSGTENGLLAVLEGWYMVQQASKCMCVPAGVTNE